MNNYADTTGSVLYGGAIDNCTLTGMDSHSSGKVFNTIVHIENNSYHSAVSQISSEPLHIRPILQTAVNLNIMIHAQCILVKRFGLLWLQLDKGVEQCLAQWEVL